MKLPGNRGEKEVLEKCMGSTMKDSPLRLAKIIAFFVVFVSGLVIGLATSSHIYRHLTSRASSSFYMNRALNSSSEKNCSIVQKCEKVECLSMGRFLRPSNLSHGLSDMELFWRASLVSKKKEYPYRRVPKVAFMFLTRGPMPLLPLWERFFHSHEKLFSIYVHAPPGYKLNVSTTSAFYGRQVPSQNVEWGTVTLADAERRLLANALLDFSNERFVLLSETCIPVYNFKTVYKYLISSTRSFVDSYDDPSRYGRGRYSRNMLPEIKLAQWRKGSQWFELSRALATDIVADTKYYAIFSKYCKPSCYPDEHYIPTYLNMFYGDLVANRSVTWVDWSMGGPHPATFEKANITEGFIQSIRKNETGTVCSYNSANTSLCYLFARKFSPTALEPLLNLTSTLMQF